MPLELTAYRGASFEHDVSQREDVRDLDIHLSRLSGIAPSDIHALTEFTRAEGLWLVIRCPKRPARHFHGLVAPKPAHVKQKSDPQTGLVRLPDGQTFVSDYDLMSVWRYLGGRDYEKIFFSEPDPSRPNVYTAEAQALLDRLGDRLKSAFQHGAQDDYVAEDHPNVQMNSDARKPIDRFMAFNLGNPSYVATAAQLQVVYERTLGAGTWPYDAQGRHIASAQHAAQNRAAPAT